MIIENRPTVSSELFEDEVVIVNLENGNYYSYSGSGIDIWRPIKDGIGISLLKEAFEKKYKFNAKQAGVFDGLIKELLQEGLIIENSENTSAAIDESNFRHDEFRIPTLNKFTDMQDLLLLDPIHDVDATGWPKQKEDSSEEIDSTEDGK